MNDNGLTCRELVELITDYAEGALDEPTLSRVEEHLALCEGCAIYLDQINAIMVALKRMPPEPVPGELRRALVGALVAN